MTDTNSSPPSPAAGVGGKRMRDAITQDASANPSTSADALPQAESYVEGSPGVRYRDQWPETQPAEYIFESGVLQATDELPEILDSNLGGSDDIPIPLLAHAAPTARPTASSQKVGGSGPAETASEEDGSRQEADSGQQAAREARQIWTEATAEAKRQLAALREEILVQLVPGDAKQLLIDNASTVFSAASQLTTPEAATVVRLHAHPSMLPCGAPAPAPSSEAAGPSGTAGEDLERRFSSMLEEGELRVEEGGWGCGDKLEVLEDLEPSSQQGAEQHSGEVGEDLQQLMQAFTLSSDAPTEPLGGVRDLFDSTEPSVAEEHGDSQTASATLPTHPVPPRNVPAFRPGAATQDL